MNDKLHLFSLPNEVSILCQRYLAKQVLTAQVFVQVLTPFTTRDLLRLTTVSYRFHALVLRILHYRLLVAASLREYKLIFECYHPVQKLTEPHVFCKYLGTDGLSDKHEGEGSLYENVETSRQLGRLTSLYSRFRPEVTVEERMMGTRLVPLPGRTPRLENWAEIEEKMKKS